MPILDADMTSAEALIIAAHFMHVVSKRSALRRELAHLAIKPPPAFREFVRDYWMLYSIAVDLGCSVSDLAADRPQHRSKVDWSRAETASHHIVSLCARAITPTRHTIDLRLRGTSWQRILRATPDRPPFSVLDDYRQFLAQILRTEEACFLLAHVR